MSGYIADGRLYALTNCFLHLPKGVCENPVLTKRSCGSNTEKV